jgi:hypothetical protein
MTTDIIRRRFENRVFQNTNSIILSGYNYDNVASLEWEVNHGFGNNNYIRRLEEYEVCLNRALLDITNVLMFKHYLIFRGYFCKKPFERKWLEVYVKKQPQIYFIRKILFKEMTNDLLTFISGAFLYIIETEQYYMQWWLAPIAENNLQNVVTILDRLEKSFILSTNEIIIDSLEKSMILPIFFPSNIGISTLSYNFFERISPTYLYETESLLTCVKGCIDDPETSAMTIGSYSLLKRINDLIGV